MSSTNASALGSHQIHASLFVGSISIRRFHFFSSSGKTTECGTENRLAEIDSVLGVI